MESRPLVLPEIRTIHNSRVSVRSLEVSMDKATVVSTVSRTF